MVNAIPIVHSTCTCFKTVHTLTIPGHAMKKEQLVKMGYAWDRGRIGLPESIVLYALIVQRQALASVLCQSMFLN